MYANTLKAKVLSCLFAVTLIVGLCPGLTTTAYANTPTDQTEGTEVSDASASDADVSSDEADGSASAESASEDESGQGTVLDDLALDSVETELYSLAEVTDWTEVSGSDFQIGSAGSEAVTIGSAANDGSDCYFEGSGATGILHIQSSTPIAIRNTDLNTATANTIQIDAGVKAEGMRTFFHASGG
jgi:hypothetical protein